jgi:ribosomal protein S18 acetylase RimI-like enzyme
MSSAAGNLPPGVPGSTVDRDLMSGMDRSPGENVENLDDVAHLVDLDPPAFRHRIAELIGIYLTAMHYPADLAGARAVLWEEHSRRAGFSCVVAVGPDDRIRGLAYGYRGAAGQWWYSEVRRGMRPPLQHLLADFFELTELHIHPDWQGRGLGEALLRRLADGRPEKRMLLSTPEGDNRAWRLYRRLGFTDMLRHYRFTGDPRPFGVLGTELPFGPPGTFAAPGGGWEERDDTGSGTTPSGG